MRTLVVTVKYVIFILRADHHGEGGILALSTLVRRQFRDRPRVGALAAVAGVIGASLLFGDSVITPAISVLSAVEGLEVAYPDLPHIVVPISLAIIVGLFMAQRFGTEKVGRAFGPIMALWFVVLAALGIPHIVADPSILISLSPTYAFAFLASEPFIGFIAVGAVVLVVTGAEALYADVGHFGRGPIRLGWFALVFPSLTICYLGQGALILADPSPSTTRSSVSHPGGRRCP